MRASCSRDNSARPIGPAYALARSGSQNASGGGGPALRGTDLYYWTSKKSGASIKSVIDGYLLRGLPVEWTGIGQGRVRLAIFGDSGTLYNPSGTMGKDPEDLTNPSYLTVLELAYAHDKDLGYAWILSRACRGSCFFRVLQFDATGRYVLGLNVYCQNRDVQPDVGDIQ